MCMNMCELRIALIGRRMRSCAPGATICEYFSEKSFLFKTEFIHIVDGCAAISAGASLQDYVTYLQHRVG